MRKYLRGAAAALAALTLAAALVITMYLNDYYPADSAAMAALSGTEQVSVQTEGRLTAFVPVEAHTGFIFYPGGKVEHTAYSPLLLELAQNGVLCVLVEMPGKLAVLDVDAAHEIPTHFPEIGRWFLGGHSLGGSMAASYAAEHSGALSGLVLLAAYSTADLTDSGLPVLSLYGDQDQVLNLEKYGQYRSNLPQDAQELVLPGGNHANFGSYGPQDGDGRPTLSPQEQHSLTVRHLAKFFDTPQ